MDPIKDIIGFFRSLLCKCYVNEITVLESVNATLRRQNGECVEQIIACQDDKSVLEVENKDLKEDAEYFENRCNALTEMLGQAITIPDISSHIDLDKAVKVDPYEDPALFPYDTLAADKEYYAFPKETWTAILAEIQPVVKKTLERYQSEVSDCDNFSLTMHAFTAIAFRKAELDRQGAFMITWSRSHAYNAYLDADGQTWIYEPQNGETIGKLETVDGSYETRIIWFPGKQVS